MGDLSAPLALIGETASGWQSYLQNLLTLADSLRKKVT